MDNNIKSEFKDFIRTLSTEICKEVLLEEIQAINMSFNKTSKNYKTLSKEYTNNINGIKEQLNQLHTTNKKLDKFIINIDTNNNKVNKALNVIEGSHKKVIDNIMADNKKLFNEYSKKVQSLNETEKKQFISSLISSMDAQSKKYLIELNDVINGSKIEEILKNINIISSNINLLDSQVKDAGKNLASTEKKVIEEIGKNVATTENQITKKINQLNSSINNISTDLNNKIVSLNIQLNNKNNIIIALTSLIIVLCIVLLFNK